MTLKELAFRLISVFEGCRLKAYPDSGGVWTIALGHTKDVKKGDTCTLEQAYKWWEEDSAPLLKRVEGKMPILIGAAYVSFAYNCGAGALSRVLAGERLLGDYIRDRRGNILPGLVSRRALEAALIELGSESEK